MASAAPAAGLLDLEKELSCSICTDTLYQPLTLLDCLHTFCGSCLKLWFAWQASQALEDEDDPSRRARPYTCPSCRAHVRDTRPDAKITTLLDMYLMANPGKSKTTEEKEEMDAKYKPGENVIPKLDSIENRRMVQEVRRASLRDAHRSGRGYQRGVRHHAGAPRPEGSDNADPHQQAVQLEHQSSLRSLISRDEINSTEMQEEILAQIVEEGLLEDIDLNSMTPEQEDELSERIAEAYRRRLQTGRRRERQRRDRSQNRETSRSRNHSRAPESRSPAHSPARNQTATPTRSPGRPHARSTAESNPSSRHGTSQREDLLQAEPVQQSGHRRRLSEGRRQTAPVEAITASNTAAARSATDLSQPPSSAGRLRRSSHGVTGSEILAHRQILSQTESPTQHSPNRSPPLSPPAVPASGGHSGRGSARNSPRQASSPSAAPSTVPIEHTVNQHPHIVAHASYHAGTQVTAPYHPRTSSVGNTNNIPGLARLKAYPEIVINCERCNKPNIQYELHHNCSTCKGGKFNICHRCYKLGRGCLNWYGFGYTSWSRYTSQGAPTPDLPHVLFGVRYRKPRTEEVVTSSQEGQNIMTREPPAKRRRSGAFCFSCHEYADDFFYKCDACNQGEWGFCRDCVNQGKCCTHPLLPIAWTGSHRQKTSQKDLDRGVQATFAPTTDPNMIQPFPPSKTISTRQYRPLTITTSCNRCRRPIQPVQSRFHCPQCSEGVTDFCKECYAQLQASDVIKREDGEKGWRRCPQGHRMIVYYFQDTELGHMRIVVNDLVGGLWLKDESQGATATTGTTSTADERRYCDGQDGQSVTTSRATMQPQPGAVGRPGSAGAQFPPDGGVGQRCYGKWSWIPEDGAEDELMFPKGAEVTEVLGVNEAWSEGSYAGRKGVFPTNHVVVVNVVTM